MIASGSSAGLPDDRVIRLQGLDSLCQRIAALPGLVRSLKAAVPADLLLDDDETVRAFSASMCAYQGAGLRSPSEISTGTGDCEIWKS